MTDDAAQLSFPPFDRRTLRDVFGSFATGVTVVTTTQADGVPRGFTANSFTSVSLDPPLVLVCIARTASSCATFADAPGFAVNVLAEDQGDVSGLFASNVASKFAQCDWTAGPGGVPLIRGALARVVCSHDSVVEAGDHIILIGRVTAIAARMGSPLGFFRGRYFRIGLEDHLVHAAADGGGTRVGAILERDGAILLCDDGAGRLSLPASPGSRPSIEALETALAEQGLRPRTDFLYAVFDDRRVGGHAIYYHGRLDGTADPPAGYRMIALADLASATFGSEAELQMLARYAQEYRHGSFGIYGGNETTGTVRRLTGPSEAAPEKENKG
jgi:flavin reductase (DIM6/NTAB) family NADH-FMN oxidoreductase RutF